MTPNETKLQNLRNYLDTLIGEYREAISSSVREMEKFNISPEDFRKESVSLNVAAFTLGYLNLAKEVSEKSDYKTTENYIRFHKHQIETKAIGEAGVITLAQNATISALSTIITLYLDNNSSVIFEQA